MISSAIKPQLRIVIQCSKSTLFTSPKLGRRALVSTAGIGIATTIGIAVAGIGTAAAATVLASSSSGSSSTSPSSSSPPRDPQALVRSGMRKFADQGDVEGSVEDFDAALAAKKSMRPYLWQRGLSLYYIGTKEALQEGAAQFRDDVAVNPNDTEESIWAFLCEAQAAYEAFKTGGDPSSITAAANGDTNGHAAFYSSLYVGLWHEAENNVDEAKEAILRAIQTDYAKGSGDYMAALARVHVKRRGW